MFFSVVIVFHWPSKAPMGSVQLSMYLCIYGMLSCSWFFVCFDCFQHEVQKEANLSEKEKSEKDKKKYVDMILHGEILKKNSHFANGSLVG